MTKNTLSTILKVLSSVDFENKETVLAEVEKEAHRGDAAREAKVALYDAAEPVVMEALEIAGTAVTAAELFEECKGNLPSGFTKAQLNYGLTHQWAGKVDKTEGKVNTYRKRA